MKKPTKSVHYANGFIDETLKQCAFILDDIEQYLCLHKIINHSTCVCYFNEMITAKGFEMNPQNLVMARMDSLIIYC